MLSNEINQPHLHKHNAFILYSAPPQRAAAARLGLDRSKINASLIVFRLDCGELNFHETNMGSINLQRPIALLDLDRWHHGTKIG